jgi:hypothetical protein
MTSPKNQDLWDGCKVCYYQQQQQETHVPTPDPKMTSPKNQDLWDGCKVCYSNNNNNNKHMSPTQIPRWHPQKIRTWDGCKQYQQRYVVNKKSSFHTFLLCSSCLFVCLFVCCFDLILILHLDISCVV